MAEAIKEILCWCDYLPSFVSYRIRRASELFGIDLQDDNQIARMLVSFAIMRIEGV